MIVSMNQPEQLWDPEGACIWDLMDGLRARDPELALYSPGRLPLTFGGLLRQVGWTGSFLNGHGLGRNDRVAAVLPNSPEAVTAFLGVSAVATYAPLNPAFRQAEFEFFLKDIEPKALLIQAGADSLARAAALGLNIPLIELVPRLDAEAGRFDLSCAELPRSRPLQIRPAEAGDTALILHTSGTTSRPKQVPLLHRNLVASTRHFQAAAQLTEEDRCLNLMPLFHLSGLISAVLSTLSAGGSLVCAPTFTARAFFQWLEAFRPTWYTAVPTLHQAIADFADLHPSLAQATSLNQIRSSAAHLPQGLLARLESLFGVPVIEAYGMTETHLIASNPRPPRARKSGSVGLPAGPEVALMGEDGQVLPSGASGEIVLRGPNVFSGYLDQVEANAAAFREGWFRTGDLGRFDEDGYLFIEGRVKDLINRGGQKVSPREVEDALLAHPGVKEAVVFAMPHGSLGEAVAAAVVPQPGPRFPEQSLRAFLADRLAPYKVPQRILRVGEIPLGATGKIQRGVLAEHWKALLAQGALQDPSPVLEEAYPEAWREAAATESVLRKHPAILRSAVLPKLDPHGELHLAAFVVLGRPCSQQDAMLFLMREGPGCMIPSAFVGLESMPRDSEGQVDFAKLAAIPVHLDQDRRPLETVELLLARIWEDTLQGGSPAPSDDFFQSGGDSLKAVDLLLRIEQELGATIPPEVFFRCATLGALVRAVQHGTDASGSPLVKVQAGNPGMPFFFVHGDFNGWGFHCPRLARLLGEDRNFFTFHPDGLPGQPDPTSIEAMVDRYLPLLREAQPTGPYLLGGHCNGALVAFEMAKRLEASGERVDLLTLVSPPPAAELGRVAGTPPPIPPGIEIHKQTPGLRRAILVELYRHALRSYRPGAFRGRIQLLATAADLRKGGPTMGWEAHSEGVEVHQIPGDHLSIFGDHLEDLAACLGPLLQTVSSATA
jgi:acyl-CoA synthetase (AMP-forming)/AMP-acid ligase II/thioesterase domain-containing protein/acyl carrier protein